MLFCLPLLNCYYHEHFYVFLSERKDKIYCIDEAGVVIIIEKRKGRAQGWLK